MLCCVVPLAVGCKFVFCVLSLAVLDKACVAASLLLPATDASSIGKALAWCRAEEAGASRCLGSAGMERGRGRGRGISVEGVGVGLCSHGCWT